MTERYRVNRSMGGGYTVRQTDLAEDVVFGAAGVAGNIIGAGIGGIGSLVRNSRDRKLSQAAEDMVSAAQREDFDSLLRMATAFSQKYRQEPIGPAFLSFALAGKGQYNEAHSAAERAVQLGLDPSEAIDLRINIYERKGDAANLIKECSTLTQSNDRQYEGYFRRARALMEIGDFDQALADANRAISLSPDEYGYCMRGNIYRDLGQFAEAVADYSRAIRLNPKDPDFFERRANAYERLEKTDEARADREEAQRMASHAKTSARRVDAIELIVFLGKAGIRLKPTSSGELDVVGRGLTQDGKSKLDDLKTELLDLLRPDNDRGAAMILLAWLRAQNVELEATASGDVRVTRGRLGRENQAELDRLKPEMVELLAE